jgi:putative transposase
MKRARFSEQIIGILREEEAGVGILREEEAGAKVTELCRRHGISDATFYTWRSKYGGVEVSELRRLRQLEEENRRLKEIVADQALDIRALKGRIGKNGYARGEATDGGGGYGPASSIASSRLRADRNHPPRVSPPTSGGSHN